MYFCFKPNYLLFSACVNSVSEIRKTNSAVPHFGDRQASSKPKPRSAQALVATSWN